MILLQKLWNPFRDWNFVTNGDSSIQRDLELQKLWNPFRDWNQKKRKRYYRDQRFKNSETLLGIETRILSDTNDEDFEGASKTLKPF